MPNCGAPGCTNRSSVHPEKSFHKLPAVSRPKIRDSWIVNIKRQFIPKELYICSDHFEEDCFIRDLKVSFTRPSMYCLFVVFKNNNGAYKGLQDPIGLMSFTIKCGCETSTHVCKNLLVLFYLGFYYFHLHSFSFSKPKYCF